MNACIRCSGRRQGQYVQRFGHYCKRCFGVVAVSAQARLQVSASAVWFGIVDTALDSAGASRKHNRTSNNDQDINHN